MNPKEQTAKAAGEFDAVAEDYERTLGEGLSVSGEDSSYFAEGRVAFLTGRLKALGERPKRVLDFGCGTGSAAPFLLSAFELDGLVGIDVSERSIEVASRRHGGERARFLPLDAHEPKGDFDLAFCNGVFHHIPPAERARAVETVWRSLRPGGLWAFWENNPYNPGTRFIMSRLPFDRDAVTLSAREARRLLRAGGFQILDTNHYFVFPGFLRKLRVLEPYFVRLPIGAQYQVLCRKPA